MKRLSAVLIVLAALSTPPVEARQMETVLQECASAGALPAYVACIKDRYSKKGNSKKAGIVMAFYTMLDEIEEVYTRSTATPNAMGNAQAKANVYRAWQATIDASNRSQPSKTCSMNGNTLTCT